MSKNFFIKSAIQNIKNNKSLYMPFILSNIFIISMVYMMMSMWNNPAIEDHWFSEPLALAMTFGVVVISIFSLIFLFYTNGIILKNREKEFALYNVLGMNKKNLSKIIFLENMIVFGINFSVGLALGIFFDKLMFLVLLKLIDIEGVFNFYISPIAILSVLLVFGSMYFLLFLNSIRKVYMNKNIELLKSSEVAEKEPKSKVIISLIGVVLLAAGYYIAINTISYEKVLEKFFIAVILVVIATYILFWTGSITFLKFLKNRKKLYYKTNNFISISNMLYRMKRNALGLASICILSTMVLVMVSSTLVLSKSVENTVKDYAPSTINLNMIGYINDDNTIDKVKKETRKTLENKNVKDYEEYDSKYLIENKDTDFSNGQGLDNSDKIINIFVPAKYIKKYDKENILDKLSYNKMNYITIGGEDTLENIELLGEKYDVAKIEGLEFNRPYELHIFINIFNSSNAKGYRVFLMSDDQINKAVEKIALNNSKGIKNNISIYRHLGYEYKASKNVDKYIYEKFTNIVEANDFDKTTGQLDSYYRSMSSRSENIDHLRSGIGIILFLAMFLGSIFIVGAIIIIYYKQVNEGYEDRNSFEIMTKVGLSKKDIKKSVKSQILTVFFMPLIVATIHLAFASPMISRIIKFLGIFDVNIQIKYTVITFGVFAVLYSIIYLMTSQAYYKIIRK